MVRGERKGRSTIERWVVRVPDCFEFFDLSTFKRVGWYGKMVSGKGSEEEQ
jgi:hypothetical protein